MGEGTSYGPYILDQARNYAREAKSKPAAAPAPENSSGSVKIVLLKVDNQRAHEMICYPDCAMIGISSIICYGKLYV